MIAQSVYTWLTANVAIAAYVDDRIFPMYIPQDTPAKDWGDATAKGALTFIQEAGDQIEHLSGQSETVLSEFTLDCYSLRYLTAKNLADTVISELVGVRGAFGTNTAESVRLVNRFDVEPEQDTGLYRDSLRIAIAYY